MAKVIDATLRLVDQFTPTLRAVDSAVKANESAMKGATNATKGAGAALNAYAKDMQEAEKINQRVSKSINGIGKSINNAAKKLAMLSAGLAAAATEGIKYHSEYEDGMAKVSTAIDRNVVSLQGLSDGLRKISDDTGRSVIDLSAAEYQALSANVDAAHATEFMSAATKASIAGFSDSTTAIDGLTTVLNAYGMKTEEVGKVSDQMIAAQSLGKTTFNEIALSIGGVATSASMAGVKTEDLLASIDMITKKGVKTPEAITQIQGMITALQKQSDQTKKAAASIGMDFSEAHLKAVGYANFMQELKDKSGGDSTILTHIFGRVEGTNGFKELTADMSDFTSTLDKIKNSSGATAEGFEAMMTPAQKTRIAMNQLKNAGMDLGAGMAPVLRRTTAMLKSVANTLNAMSPAQKEMLVDVVQFIVVGTIGLGVLGKAVTTFGSVFGSITDFASAVTKAGGIIPLLTGKLMSLINTLKMVGMAMKMMFLNPWGIAIVAIIGLAYLLYTNWEPIKTFFTDLWTAVGNAFDAGVSAANNQMEVFASYWTSTKAFFAGIWNSIEHVFSAGVSAVNNQMEVFGSYWTGTKAFFAGIWNAIEAVFSAGVNAIAAWMDKTGITASLQTLFVKIQLFTSTVIALWEKLKSSVISVTMTLIAPIITFFISAWNFISEKTMIFAEKFIAIWTKVKTAIINIFSFVAIGIAVIWETVSEKAMVFGATLIRIWTNLKTAIINIFAAVISPIVAMWSLITSATKSGGNVLESIIGWIKNFFVNGFNVMVNIAKITMNGWLNNIATIINGVIAVFGGIITFITGVFSGNWAQAWQGIVEIFSGIFNTIAGVCNTVLGTVKSIINEVIGGINNISIDIPDWVPKVGGQHYAPSIPMLATGTNNWSGGPAMIHDAGPEIVDLPSGSRVIPHSESMKQEYQRGKSEALKAGISLTIAKLADTIIVREDADIDKIATKIVQKLSDHAQNQAIGAI